MSLEATNLWIAICLTFISVCILAFVAGILVAVFAIKNMLSKTLKDAKPAINQATETMRSVKDVVNSVQGRVDHIMQIAEGTAQSVSKKVETTSSMITKTISPPLISVSSVVTGVARGLEMWSMLKKHGGNGHEK